MAAAHVAVLTTLVLMAPPVAAQLHDIVFDERGGAALRAQVLPGRSLQWCGMLQPGDDVHWEFESADPLDMKVSSNDGTAAVDLVAPATVSMRSGRFLPEGAHSHCWTWTNHAQTPVALQARLQRSARRPAS